MFIEQPRQRQVCKNSIGDIPLLASNFENANIGMFKGTSFILFSKAVGILTFSQELPIESRFFLKIFCSILLLCSVTFYLPRSTRLDRVDQIMVLIIDSIMTPPYGFSLYVTKLPLYYPSVCG